VGRSFWTIPPFMLKYLFLISVHRALSESTQAIGSPDRGEHLQQQGRSATSHPHTKPTARGPLMNHILSHEGNDSRTTRQTDISAHYLRLSNLRSADILFTSLFSASAIVAFTICRAVFHRNLQPVAHSAQTHSSLVTTNLVHCALTTRC